VLKTMFDVCVIGGGHAAIEAALAPARLGFQVIMVILDASKIGQMSCNPAIGGTAKGQVVREIDALGGEMARAADDAGIQFKMLNRGKGPAVWSPRAQCDRRLYREFMTERIKAQSGITVLEAEVTDIVVKNNRVVGVATVDGREIGARVVILSSGTFMRGLLHTGPESWAGGRWGERPAAHLSDALRALGFEVGRMKTGTPMRIDGRTVDHSQCREDPGDDPPIPFSHRSRGIFREQVPCWLTYTNLQTHEIIRRNLHRSPLYSGKIESIGPRYCPSIEDKVVKFPHHNRHLVFLEPEGLGTDEVYVNGLFTSLPRDVQEEIICSIRGLERARIVRYGYAVEYDYCSPLQIWPTLETKGVKGLFFAGQINGTTGYEEAAGQGLLAGINAVMHLRNEEPLVLRRDEAYVGVMMDDLVTKGVDEPYRLLTARAEYRLLLRWDNADLRLMKHGRRVGLVDDKMFEDFERYRMCVADSLARAGSENGVRSEMKFGGHERLAGFDGETFWSENDVRRQVDIHLKYDGYIRRQVSDIQRMKRMEFSFFPPQFDYNGIPGLLSESREKLSRVRPATLGQAARIPGVAPSDIALLSVWIRRWNDRPSDPNIPPIN